MTRDPNATQAEEFNLVAPEVFTENLINVENIHLDGQKYEQTIHQYSLLISQKHNEIEQIIKKQSIPLPIDKQSVNTSRKALSHLQQQIESYQGSVPSFTKAFAPPSVITNILTNQRRLEIDKKLQRLSAWSNQLNLLISKDQKKQPDILRLSQLSSMILQEMDGDLPRINYCANRKTQVLAKTEGIENTIKNCVSNTTIKNLTIQDLFILVIIFRDPAPLFKDSSNIKKRLQRCNKSNSFFCRF